MGVLIKYTLRNIKEKKFRLGLILFSIALSSALLFASMAIGPNVEGLYAAQMKSMVGDADIKVQVEDDNRTPYFSDKSFEALRDTYIYAYGVNMGSGSYEADNHEIYRFNLIGANLEEVMAYNPFPLISHLDQPFEGRWLIISQLMADKYELDLGDTLEIQAYGQKSVLVKIWGIASPVRLFSSQGDQGMVVMPRSFSGRLTGQGGEMNLFLIKTEKDQVFETIERLNQTMPGFLAEETLPLSDLREAIASISAMFYIMLIMVVLITVFIIYSSFKVIMMERLPVIGTFRSIGATRLSTNLLLMGESILYGLIGGLLGSGLGLILLKLMTKVLSYDPYSKTSTDLPLIMNPGQALMTILFALTIALVSSLIPIVKTSKYAIKDIVQNKIEQPIKNNLILPLLGILGLITCLLLPASGLIKGHMALNALVTFASIIFLILIVPILSRFLIFLLEGLYLLIFGNHGLLALKNLRENKNLLNNMVLLTMGISSLFLINVISYSIGVEVVNVYSKAHFDIMGYVGGTNRTNIQQILSVEGVQGVYGGYVTYNVPLYDQEDQIMSLYGVDPYKYFDYWDYDLIGDPAYMKEALINDRSMVLNKSLAVKFNKAIGDTLDLEIDGAKRTYTIVGLISTLMNNGQMALISDRYFRIDFGAINYDEVLIKTQGDPTSVHKALSNRFGDVGYYAMTMEDMEASNTQANNQILVLLSSFSILAMVIGVFGVFNNYMVNILSRKRSLAMYRSVGMSQMGMRQMLFLEALTGGLIGGLAGLIGGLSSVYLVGYLMTAMNLPVAMHIAPTLPIMSLLGGMTVSLLASVSPVLRSAKSSIIHALKYE